MIGLVVLGLVLLALGCVLGAGVIRREEEREDARMREAEEREARVMNDQFDMNKAMKLDGTHLFRRRGWKPAIAYLAPERTEPPKPANVQSIRRAKR